MKKRVKPKAISGAATRGEQNRLAKRLGISRQLLSLHLKDPSAPKLNDIEGWINYQAAHGRAGSDPPDIKRKIAEKRLELIAAQVAKVNRENEEANGKLEHSEEVSKAQRFAMQTVKAQWQRLVRDGPSLLSGLTEIEIRKKLEDYEARILPELTEAFKGAVLILIALFLVGCKSPDWEPVYSAVPPAAPVIMDVEQMPEMHFAYKTSPEEASHVYLVEHTNSGWTEVRDLPPIDNFEELSNFWYRAGVESYYSNGVIHYHEKPRK